MASFHTHASQDVVIFQDLVNFQSMYETRIKELWELTAKFGISNTGELINVLERDLALREKEYSATNPKALAIQNAKNMNRYVGNIYREWSKLRQLLFQKQRLTNTGGKLASKEKAEINRSIQHVRNQTCYNKRKLIDMEIDDIENYVERLKLIIENN
jgi:hypothetical protein